jgi:hypothetical protein
MYAPWENRVSLFNLNLSELLFPFVARSILKIRIISHSKKSSQTYIFYIRRGHVQEKDGLY